MTEKTKPSLNWALILPIGLLVIEIIVFFVMRIADLYISEFLFYFFILLALFLIYQISKQLTTTMRVQRALHKFKEAESLAQSGQHFAALRLWKRLLFSLPQDKYLQVLNLMEATYHNLGMAAGEQQVKAIRSESIEFFETARRTEKPTMQDRQNWQRKTLELRAMINALPEQ